MGLTLPYSLSPSRVASFTSCALAFRFSTIDGVPEPPTRAAVRGTVVHAALERLYARPAAERRRADAGALVGEALHALADDPELLALVFDDAGRAELTAEATVLVDRLWELEDPAAIEPIGIELKLEVVLGDLRLRGIIDRLDRTADGRLVVVDYKTGRVPSAAGERPALGGVQVYALICEQLFGARPAEVHLHHLAAPVTIVAVPDDQSARGVRRRLGAIWAAIERACEDDDFRPRPSARCGRCAYRDLCPTFGGDPRRAPEVAAAARADRRWERRRAEAEAAGQSPLALDLGPARA